MQALRVLVCPDYISFSIGEPYIFPIHLQVSVYPSRHNIVQTWVVNPPMSSSCCTLVVSQALQSNMHALHPTQVLSADKHVIACIRENARSFRSLAHGCVYRSKSRGPRRSLCAPGRFSGRLALETVTVSPCTGYQHVELTTSATEHLLL